MDFQSLFLSPNGRIGRQEFWIGFLILFAAGLVIGFIPFLNLIFGVASIYFWVCLYAKRLHDMGKSAVLVVIPYAVWFVCLILAIVMGGFAFFSSEMASSPGTTDTGAAAATVFGSFLIVIVAALINLAFLLWVGLSSGQPGDNKYGAPPAAHPVSPAVSAPPTVSPPPPAPASEPPAA